MYTRVSSDIKWIIITVLIVSLFDSCSTDQTTLPEVLSYKPSELLFTSAKLRGVVINSSSGAESIIETGICLNTDGNPDLNDIVLRDENSDPNIEVLYNELEAATTYYYRAYAINDIGVSFGNTLQFKTPETLSEAFQNAVNDQQAESFDKGLSASFIMPDGSMWQGTYGHNDEDVAITPESVFFAGEITMTFVSSLMLLLEGEKYISVNSSYTDFIDAIENCRDDITIKQLLDHTNGLHGFTDEQFYLDRLLESEIVYSPAELLEIFHIAPPYCLPGKQYNTDGPGYLLAAMILESLTAESLLTEMHNRILSVLGLENTYWGGYESFTEDSGGLFYPRPDEPHSRLSYKALLAAVYGSENIVTTPTDLAILYRSLAKGELFDLSTLEKMMTVSPLSVVYENDGSTSAYGLGIGVRVNEAANETEIFHEGELGNISSVFYSFKYDIAAACMTNNPESSNTAITMMKKAYKDFIENGLSEDIDDISVK